MPIHDWIKKREAFKCLYEAASVKDLARKIDPKTDSGRVNDLLNKWQKSDPTNTDSIRIINKMLSDFKIKMTANQFIQCEYGDFYQKLPHEIKDKVPAIRRRGSVILDGDFHVIHRHIALSMENKEVEWRTQRRVDQLHMYQSHDSYRLWEHVRTDGKYRSHEQCLQGLRELLESEGFQRIAATEALGSAVIFGAGSPEKEKVIADYLASVHPTNQERSVLLIDASYYMLVGSYTAVHDHLRTRGLSSINLNLLQADFTKIAASGPKLKNILGDARSVFFIPGGTFGNNSESEFLRTLAGLSKPGDILVVAIDVVPTPISNNYERQIVDAYNSNAIKDLVLNPVRHYLDKEGVAGDISQRRSMVSAKIKRGDSTDIGNTLSVQMILSIDGDELALSISKKYTSADIIGYFESKGFSCIISPPDGGAGIQQFVFRRIAPPM